MNLATALIIKQNLNGAYLLTKPKYASLEVFKTNLVSLLQEINKEENKKKSMIYLEGLFKDTYFDPEYLEPEYNSPVCFATIGNLREGFEEPCLPKGQTAADGNNNLTPAISHYNPNASNFDLRDAMQLVKLCIIEIIKDKQGNSNSNYLEQEKQINGLVYQFYELSPEEIATVEKL